MKNLITAFVTALLMTISIFGQTNIGEANYRIYDRQGNESSLEKIIESLKGADVVFLGESHDDPTAHYLQNEIFRRAFEKYSKDRRVALSLEMFERDVQIVVNEYLQNLISETHFLQSSRAWGNYKTDYKPLLEFAKTNKLEVIAANAPRRYVNMVSRNGRESLKDLSPEAMKWLAPLPYAEASDAYARKFYALMGQSSDTVTPVKHSPMLNSQALWDATMAFSISEYLARVKNPLVVNLNGAFHSENRLGTPEHLLKYSPKTKFLVVTMRSEENFTNFEKSKHADLGDFVILTDAKLPRSQK